MSLRGEAEGGGGVRKIMFAVDCSLLLLYHLSTAKFISHVISQRVYCYVLKGGGGGCWKFGGENTEAIDSVAN